MMIYDDILLFGPPCIIIYHHLPHNGIKN